MRGILCVPEARAQFGYGHLARQCILVNYLRLHALEAFLVLPDSICDDRSRITWVFKRIRVEHVLFCTAARARLAASDSLDRVVIDSYDLVHTAATVGRNPNSDALTVFDDLAYEHDYPANITPVIPNVCSRQQRVHIARSHRAGHPVIAFGADHVLIHPTFLLSTQQRDEWLFARQRRLRACQQGLRPLVVLFGFGGSTAIHAVYDIAGQIERILANVALRCASVQLRCIGNAPEALCAVLGTSVHSLGWLDVPDLGRAYLSADLYVGSIGYSMWERASLLLPSIVLPIANNQVPYAQVGEELGIHRLARVHEQADFLLEAFDMQNSAAILKLDCNAYFSLFA